MSSSKTQIANIALSHIGIGKEISSFTEKSEAAHAINRFWDIALDAVLRDFDWPFATKFVTLALIEVSPNSEWGYSYQYPSDCLKLRRIPSGLRVDTLASRIAFKLVEDEDGHQAIFTDKGEAEMEYTKRIDAVERFSPDFVMALSYRLAVYIAPRLTGGDPFKLGDKAAKMYLYELALAHNSAAGEEQSERPAESEFITER